MRSQSRKHVSRDEVNGDRASRLAEQLGVELRLVPRMEPAVLTAYVTPWGHLPHLVIDARPAAISPRNSPPPAEVGLNDDDALELLRRYRLPNADLGRWL